jgi:hypothetical protein
VGNVGFNVIEPVPPLPPEVALDADPPPVALNGEPGV